MHQSLLIIATCVASVIATPRRTLSFRRNGPALPCGAQTSTNYTVIAGDSLSTIAGRLHSGICDIARLNSISDPNLIFPNETLIVPLNCTSPDDTSCIATSTPSCTTGVVSAYSVHSGDTLSAIASEFEITLDGLIAANPQIQNPDLILVGELINIPICAGSQCRVVTYDIKSGDTFLDLSRKYGTSLGQIIGLNANANPTNLQIGQQIVLPTHCKIKEKNASAY